MVPYFIKSVAHHLHPHCRRMPYFFLQDEDYVTLKERTSKHIIDGASGSPEGIATIEIAIDALKVAEYLTAEGMKQFAPK